ncbi:MAG: phage tail protein [Synechococcales bacterium]|nr:phage tail protein [Synechococcales bacterium]
MKTQNGLAADELNYVLANRFYVEVESHITASFSECSGLGLNIKKESYFEGGVNDQQRIVLGQTEFTDVTLKRGITNDFTFWEWVSQMLHQSHQRRNINILLFNQAGETMQCWTLIGALPVSWKAPALQADGNAVAIEELTLAYEGLSIQKSGGGGAIHLNSGRDPSGYFAGSSAR